MADDNPRCEQGWFLYEGKKIVKMYEKNEKKNWMNKKKSR